MDAATEIVETDAGPVRGTVTDECRCYGWRSTPEVEALGAAVASQLGCAAEHHLDFWEAPGLSPAFG